MYVCRTSSDFTEQYLHRVQYMYGQCQKRCPCAGGIWHAICTLSAALLPQHPSALPGWWICHTTGSPPLLLCDHCFPWEQFPGGAQGPSDFTQRWKRLDLPGSLLSLIMALNQVLWSDLDRFGFHLKFLLHLWALDSSPCKGKFGIIKPPFSFPTFLSHCSSLLNFNGPTKMWS